MRRLCGQQSVSCHNRITGNSSDDKKIMPSFVLPKKSPTILLNKHPTWQPITQTMTCFTQRPHMNIRTDNMVENKKIKNSINQQISFPNTNWPVGLSWDLIQSKSVQSITLNENNYFQILTRQQKNAPCRLAYGPYL